MTSHFFLHDFSPILKNNIVEKSAMQKFDFPTRVKMGKFCTQFGGVLQKLIKKGYINKDLSVMIEKLFFNLN